MKKYLLLVLVGIFSCLQLSAQSSNNASPTKHEFRATWFTTVANIDWPSKSNLTVDQQKAELTNLLDQLAASNINAVCFQVRGRSDAYYKSNYEPWAKELTGTLGKDPEYDPLAFAIEETHKRGMELHAWVNPFRVSTETTTRLTEDQINSLYKAPTGKTELQWSWVLAYNNGSFTGQIIDLGNPAAREYVVNVLMDIVENYDIDGVVMDDYFYPYGGTTTQDQTSQNAYYKENEVEDVDKDGDKLDDWRRSNVDAVIADFSSKVRAAKPWVRFGMGPGGIWTMKIKAAEAYEIQLPNNIVGADLYEQLACNTVEWIENGWVDYVCPQIYWATTAAKQDYDVLCKWWAKDVCEYFSEQLPGDQRVHFYPSHAGYKVYEVNSNTGLRYEGFGQNAAEGIPEMINQIESNRQNLSSGYTGSVYFSNKDFVAMSSEIKAACYQQKALVPPMTWKSTGSLEAPTELSISGNTLTWEPEGGRYTIYVYPKELEMNTAIEQVDYLQRVVYGNSFTLPAGFNTATHNVAVRSYDRCGVEHAATEYTPDVTYVLNGGELGNRTVVSIPNVPTNAELWEAFKPYYKTFYNENRYDQPITMVSTFMTKGSEIMTKSDSEYKWLGDYIKTIAGNISGENAWRWNVHHFFNCSLAGTYWDATLNKSVNYPSYASAGQPEAWGPAYQEAHKTSTTESINLPEKIEGSAFTLPIAGEITHPNGSTFLGWYDNPDMTGNTIIELPVGYKGTVYAKWSGITWMLYGGQYTGGTLPSTVDATYTLPTKTQMQRTGFVFGGWYEKADFSGNVLTSIPANYTGVLHAKWIPANHITWHPYPYYDVTNEDLWELFMEDYNAFYNSDILGENRSYENRAYQPIGNAFGFMHSGEKLKNANGEWINKEGDVVGTEAEAHHRFPDGRATDFMTHPQSPWKWLGDYIHKVASDGVTPTNEALWEEFKKYYNEYYNDTRYTGTDITKVTTFMTKGKDIMTDNNSDFKWLGNYIKKVASNQGVTIGSGDFDTENTWRNFVSAFFNHNKLVSYWDRIANKTVTANVDFSTAGLPQQWMEADGYTKPDYSFDTNKEVEWRKHVHTFFNKTNSVTYTVVGNTGSSTATTVDFSIKGQAKPNGDPAAGWYNAWWNATFPEYMIDGETLPKIKRKNYVFGGWYYGNEKGYIFTEANKANPTAYNSENNYKNHLWGRWLELCLYEGYVDSDPAALDANEQPISPKVNNNVEMVICNAEEIARTGLSRKVDIERKLIGGTYNTMFLPFGINGQGTVKKDDDGNYISGSGICGKKYYLNQVVDDDGNPLLDPATTSILVYDKAEIENVGGEEVIAFNFHEYAEADSLELLLPYQPFLIKPANDITVRMHFWSALMNKPKTPKARTDAYQVFVEGVLAPTMLPVNPEYDNTLILVADNRLAKVTTQGEMLGLRLYFTVPKDVSPSARSIIRVNNAPAGIDDIETPQQGSAVIKIMQNGNIYIIRNGKMYDIMGREIGDKR